MAEANVTLMAALRLSVRARMMRGKTIGFIGFGRIARATLVRLANWNVRAIFFDPYVDRDTASHDGAIPAADLAALLRASDVVSILVDLTAETHGMIGAAELAMMRRDAYLVNTARGAVVDEAALATAMREGTIAGAALDAFAAEPLAPDSPLRELDNVILTPHNIGHTLELQESFIPATYENVVRISRGDPPLYFKNPQVLSKWRERLARRKA